MYLWGMKQESRLWVFNPGHEEALLHAGKASYTASKTVLTMMYELPQLMLHLASVGDYIYCPSRDGRSARLIDHHGNSISDYKGLPPLKLSLWGLEPHSLRLINTWAKGQGIALKVPDISPEYYTLAHRNACVKCLQYLHQNAPQLVPQPEIIPHRILKGEDTLDATLRLIRTQGYTRAMLKRPYSSSGRGVQPMDLPLSGEQSEVIYSLAQHYGEVSLEPLLNRQQDYALLFYADADGLRHIGYSKFVTDDKSGTAYSGNILTSDESIAEELTQVLGNKQALLDLIEYLQLFLRSELNGTYEGYIGIDMMTYRDLNGELHLHPCVEINLRCTMGVIAHRLQEGIVTPPESLFKLGLSTRLSQEGGNNLILAGGKPSDTFVAYIHSN